MREPADPTQCQTMIRSGSIMTLGPRTVNRCINTPVVIAYETALDPDDGEMGSMSLCVTCFEICQSKHPDGLRYEVIQSNEQEVV